jgi:hypothetical protein
MSLRPQQPIPPCPGTPPGLPGRPSGEGTLASCCGTGLGQSSAVPTSLTSTPAWANQPTRRGAWLWSRFSSSARA